ncbi:TAP-like protein-domain-containing protein [Pseudomassariella vexata]|uniref:TAP-like protein-domain-containing protein n=1 Tax=Pseudomassariella vexata TaxID=1141098 RepID=A0A1Y2DFC2_9PEZI|nr:TAP-like protein-domain-containing protein [Pseudomassariella vexata]ORY57804.1 TAP-like protein-domain-containing protein [Pseudomassariella vexata]
MAPSPEKACLSAHDREAKQMRLYGAYYRLGASIPIVATFLLFCAYRGYWTSVPGLGLSRSCRADPDVQAQDESFDWLKIQPTEQFEFHDCFDGFQCARLSVPMNWGNVSIPDRVSITVIKQPAKVAVTDLRYGGPILMNPGGPGESGIFQVLSGGPYVQTIVDPHEDPADHDADGKYFDIVGFDPRGVNNTTPRPTCFPDPIAEHNWAQSGPSVFISGASDVLLNQEWARKDAVGASCAANRTDGANIAYHANTAQVVQDMVAIVERHAEWREKEVKRLMAPSCSSVLARLPRMEPADHQRIAESSAWQRSREKLNYWGFSYGTVLGQTFAAMHPDRIGRVVIDGVVDAADYYKTGWTRNLQDTDQIPRKWNDYCQGSGSKDRCSFYFEGMPASYMSSIIGVITNRLRNSPIVLPVSEEGPMIFEHADIMSMLVNALYEPYRTSDVFFDVLGGLLEGPNVTRATAWKANRVRQKVLLSNACVDDGPFSETCVAGQSRYVPGVAIRCADGDDVSNDTKDEYKEYLQKLQRQSDIMGTMWSTLRLACMGWKARPAWAYKGAIEGRTTSPILAIGNTLDPVTPLRNARGIPALFPGSAVLQQNTEGHCSYSNPSIGTAKIVRAYFQNGSLPAPGTVTEPEWRPFLGCVNPSGCDSRREEDEKLWKAQSSWALV